MNKRGFTLVELLAVVIILALLALLTSTAVTKLVKDSKEELSDTQIKLIESAAKAWVADNLDKLPSSGSCSYITLGDLKEYGLIDSKVIDAETNLEISDDLKIKLTTTINSYGNPITNYEVNANDVSGCLHNLYKKYRNGAEIYFDVSTGKECSASEYNEENSKTGYNGLNPTGNQTNCLKFYAFNDNQQNKNLNLLLDHNIPLGRVKWNSSGSNTSGPKEVLEQLYDNTKEWKGTITPKDYTMDQSESSSAVKYTIEYSKTPSYTGATTPYKARLITANEVAQITGNIDWDELTSTDSFYFDTNTKTESETCKEGNTSGCKYGWLYDRSTQECTTYGCYNNSDGYMIGYWTASAYASDSSYAWYIGNNAILYADPEDIGVSNTETGIRPVIEVAKSKLQ